MLQVMLNKINESDDPRIRNPLMKLLALHGLYIAQKDFGIFYRGGYMEGNKPPTLIQEGILKLISDLKNDAVALVDVIAPADFLMNSILGKSDGEVHLTILFREF